MTWYLVHLRNQIFVRCFGFLSCARNAGQNIGRNK